MYFFLVFGLDFHPSCPDFSFYEFLLRISMGVVRQQLNPTPSKSELPHAPALRRAQFPEH